MRSSIQLCLVTALAVMFAVGAGHQRLSAAEARAATPPMGWNSWNKFGCDVSESLIREVADAIVSTGMKDAGYEYVVIDDCWQVSRTDSGEIVPDAKRFPSGMKALADYVHGRGLKFGLYSDAGTKTCQGRPGSHGFETQDARKYAEWGVDYLKYDWCSSEGIDPKVAYKTMREALDATGRTIIFSMCEWGTNKPWTWARGIGDLWRTTGDIQDCWDCKSKWGGLGWTRILDLNAKLAQYAGPGGWNDPDMLEVGNGHMKPGEYRAHFGLWALMAAPLMAGNDVRSMSADTKAILTNKDIIALDQDPLGKQGTPIRDDGDLEVWAKPLEDGSVGVGLLNRGASAHTMKVTWKELGLSADAAQVRDLWEGKDLGAMKDGYSVTVPSHECAVLRVKAAS